MAVLASYETSFKLGEFFIKKFFISHESEVEQYIIEEGKVFGDYGIIHNLPRSSSAYALENSILLSINKDLFDDFFMKQAMKSENERKSFFSSKINIFMNSSRYNEYYSKISILVNS